MLPEDSDRLYGPLACHGSHRNPALLGVYRRGPKPQSRRSDPFYLLGGGGTPAPLGIRAGIFADLPDILYDENDFCFPLEADVPVPPAAKDITLVEAQSMALAITTAFEGGKGMNYQALADNFDGQGMSFGLIQWNFGQNTLGPLLAKMLSADAKAFEACFGEGTDFATLKTALEGNKQADQLKWVAAVLKDKRTAWQSAFRAVGANATFQRIQREQAASQYHPIVVSGIKSLRSAAPELMKDVEFRTYAALFDTAVQQNGILSSAAAIKTRLEKEKPKTQLELATIAVTERARKANDRWVADCLSRRLGILAGKAVEVTEMKNTSSRVNAGYELITSHGTDHVTGL